MTIKNLIRLRTNWRSHKHTGHNDVAPPIFKFKYRALATFASPVREDLMSCRRRGRLCSLAQRCHFGRSDCALYMITAIAASYPAAICRGLTAILALLSLKQSHHTKISVSLVEFIESQALLWLPLNYSADKPSKFLSEMPVWHFWTTSDKLLPYWLLYTSDLTHSQYSNSSFSVISLIFWSRFWRLRTFALLSKLASPHW